MTDTGYSHNLRQKPDGTFEAVFEGGLELPIDLNGEENAQNTIRWVRESDGALCAVITGASVQNAVLDGAITAISAKHPDDDVEQLRQATLSLQALNVYGDPSPVVGAAAGTEFVKIIDGNGESDFARSVDLADLIAAYTAFVSGIAVTSLGPQLSIAVGLGGMLFDGSGFGAWTTVEHNIGRKPFFALAVGAENSGGDLFWNIAPLGFDHAATDDTYVTFQAQAFDLDTPPVGTWGFSWVAIG